MRIAVRPKGSPGGSRCRGFHRGTWTRAAEGGACMAALGVSPQWASLDTSCCRKWRRTTPTSCSYPRTWSCLPEPQGRCFPSPAHSLAGAAGLNWAAPVLGPRPGPQICCLIVSPFGTGPFVHCGLSLRSLEGRGVTQPRSHQGLVQHGPLTRLTFMTCPCCPHCTVREAEAPGSRVRSVGSHSPGASLRAGSTLSTGWPSSMPPWNVLWSWGG